MKKLMVAAILAAVVLVPMASAATVLSGAKAALADKDLTLADMLTYALWIDGVGNDKQGTDSTDWVLLTTNRQFLANPDIRRSVTSWKDPAPPPRFWTDNYSNLFNLLRK